MRTTLSQFDVQTILAQYDLGDLEHFTLPNSGTVQTALLVKTSKTTLILKCYENRSHQSVQFEMQLMRHIHQQNFPCPKIFENRNSDNWSVYQGKPIVLFEYMQGEHPGKLNEQQKVAVIQAAAKLQTMTEDYTSSFTSYRWNYTSEFCLDLASKEAEKRNTVKAQEKLSWFEYEVSQLELPNHMPRGYCHCDYDNSNLLFEGDNLVALIDFDDANYTYRSFDLVHLMDSWAWLPEQDFDLSKAQNIIAHYQQVRPLDKTEKEHLFDVHRLQILIDALWFFDRGTPDNFREKTKIELLDVIGRDAYRDALDIH